jgi:parvulin-like peptidyl-prolyl isomerase
MEMKTRLLLVPSLLVMLAVLAAGCGGGSSTSVPADAVATVGSTPISKSTFQALMTVAFARYKAQGQPEPKVGTAAYSQLKDQAVSYLVNEQELQQEAQKAGVTVSDQDVTKYLDMVKQTYYHGNEQKFQDALKADHISLAELVQYNIRPTLLSQKLQTKVSSSANVSTADAQKYYTQHKASYGTPAETTRSVRHILVKNKKLANQLEQKLSSGASFATLAKKYSKDPGSAAQGGKYAAVKGREVPAYDAVAFTLKTGKTSAPVNATSKANGGFGWFIIQPLGPIKKTAAKTQPFSQVESQIKLLLGQQKKGLAWSNFLAKVKKDYQGKVAYQTGYTPATTTTPTLPAQTTTTG